MEHADPTRRALLGGAAATAALTAVGAPPASAATGRAGVPYTITARDATPSIARPLHEFRGMWVATVLNVDWPSAPGLTVARQQDELRYLIALAANRGFNALLLQVRPVGDRLYRSALGEPWSRYLTGNLGQDPGWDPLAWAVDQAARRGIEVHAWANPFRVSMDTAWSSLAPGSFAAGHPEFTYAFGGRRYLDPGRPEVRLHVRAVLAEIARDYGVAGVHLDDYFYPYPATGQLIGDDASYAQYGAGRARAVWRRENVDTFIRHAGVDIHAAKARAVFSVSPFGIWRNRSTAAGGSATNGLQAYDDLYADTRRWLREQWTDLFIPQLYWQLGYAAADYDVLARWWAQQSAGSRTALAFGEAVYKVGDPGWLDRDELLRHLQLGRRLAPVDGHAFYNASAVAENALDALQRATRTYYPRKAVPVPMPWLNATRPGSPRFTAATATAEGARLDWTLPGGGEPAHWVAIWRKSAGSSTIPNLPITATYLERLLPGQFQGGTWTDRDAVRGQRYWYVIQSFSRTGTASAAGSAIMVRA